MRQLFSAYPAGFAGFALLMLRGSLVLSLVARFQQQLPHADVSTVIAFALGAGMGVGFYMRLCALGSIVAMCLAPGVTAEPSTLQLASHVLDALAMALIGPGAFSLDAHLFGRSTISLPR